MKTIFVFCFVRALIVVVEHAIFVVVQVRTAVVVLEAVFVFGLVGAMVEGIGDAVVVAIGQNTATRVVGDIKKEPGHRRTNTGAQAAATTEGRDDASEGGPERNVAFDGRPRLLEGGLDATGADAKGMIELGIAEDFTEQLDGHGAFEKHEAHGALEHVFVAEGHGGDLRRFAKAQTKLDTKAPTIEGTG